MLVEAGRHYSAKLQSRAIAAWKGRVHKQRLLLGHLFVRHVRAMLCCLMRLPDATGFYPPKACCQAKTFSTAVGLRHCSANLTWSFTAQGLSQDLDVSCAVLRRRVS